MSPYFFVWIYLLNICKDSFLYQKTNTESITLITNYVTYKTYNCGNSTNKRHP